MTSRGSWRMIQAAYEVEKRSSHLRRASARAGRAARARRAGGSKFIIPRWRGAPCNEHKKIPAQRGVFRSER